MIHQGSCIVTMIIIIASRECGWRRDPHHRFQCVSHQRGDWLPQRTVAILERKIFLSCSLQDDLLIAVCWTSYQSPRGKWVQSGFL